VVVCEGNKNKDNPFITHKRIVLDWKKDRRPVAVKKRYKLYEKEDIQPKERHHVNYEEASIKGTEEKQRGKERKRANRWGIATAKEFKITVNSAAITV
jgi:hypothetical protein